MVSTGIDALAVHNVDLRAKKYIGQMAYVLSALWSAFTYRSKKVKIYLEDQKLRDRGYLVIISNSRFYGGRYEIDEDASIDDGLFNVILFKRSSIIDTFRLMMGVLFKMHKQLKDIACYKSRAVHISAATKVKIQMDGDKAPPPPALVWLKKQWLPVIVPEDQHCQGEGGGWRP